MQQRRMTPRDERVTINREFLSVDEFIHEYVSNVSRSGAFIRSKDPLPVGTFVNLKFTLILDELETIEGIGEVVRVQERPSGMGVVFRELTSHSRKLLGELLTRAPVPAPVQAGDASAAAQPVSAPVAAAGAPAADEDEIPIKVTRPPGVPLGGGPRRSSPPPGKRTPLRMPPMARLPPPPPKPKTRKP